MNKKITNNLLARYFAGNCTIDEIKLIENWCDIAPENRTRFEQYRKIWENAKQPEQVFTPDTESALTQVNQKLGIDSKNIVYNLYRIIPRVAAAILIGFGIYLFAYTLLQKHKETAILTAESGNIKKEILLSDGSHVLLNINSILQYPETFTGKTRKVYIEGEAYFSIVKNTKRPFVIETGHSVVTVLGTEFNLRARENEKLTIVTVTEGKVSFKSRESKIQQSIYLVAGDKGLLNTKNKTLVLEKNQDLNFLSWKTGKLVFKNTPLENVTNDLSEYFNVNLGIGDTSKIKIPFTGEFDKQSLSEILTILQITLKVNIDSTGNTYILK